MPSATAPTNAFDEAAWLVLWQLGLPLDDLDGVADMAVSPQQQDSVRELVAERIAHAASPPPT